MDKDSADALRAAGFNVSVGSFETPSEVEPSNHYIRVDFESARLPSVEEQEIVIINTDQPPTINRGPIPKTGEGLKEICQSCKSGVIDPRPISMRWCQPHFERIYKHGGIFIVLLSDSDE